MKRIPSFAAIVAVVFLALSAVPASAQECPYPAGCPTASISDRTPARRQIVRYSGTNWRPSTLIKIRLAGRVVDETATDAAGAFSTPDRIPRRAPLGRQEILVLGRDAEGSRRTVAIRVRILRAGAGAGAGAGVGAEAGPGAGAPGATGGPGAVQGAAIALTGADVTGVIVLFSVLVVAGASALSASRRRKRAATGER